MRLLFIQLQPAEEVTWTGGLGAKVAGWIGETREFHRAKISAGGLINGGPQGAWNDNWGYRWNPKFMRATVTLVLPESARSTGYGQKFVADISGDWGGKVFTDIITAWPWRRTFHTSTRIVSAPRARVTVVNDRLDRATQTIRDFITRCWCRMTASTISPA